MFRIATADTLCSTDDSHYLLMSSFHMKMAFNRAVCGISARSLIQLCDLSEQIWDILLIDVLGVIIYNEIFSI